MSRGKSFKPAGVISLGAIALCACAPSWASLIADGVTYTLFESTISPTEDEFTLQITGINGPADTEGGRYGVGAVALSEPAPNSVSTGTMTGFTFKLGGMNAMGCDGKGNFFCFQANTKPTAPALPANSALTLTFDVFLNANAAGDFAGYNPSFKIGWAGTKNNYDLVSATLSPTPVPLPAALPLLLGGIAGLGFMRRRKTA